jgi:hypothetical protein
MGILTRSGKVVVSSGGSLMSSTTPSTCVCCDYPCVSCSLTGRIASVTLSGTTGSINPSQAAVCGGTGNPPASCSQVDATYGGAITTFTGTDVVPAKCTAGGVVAHCVSGSGFSFNISWSALIAFNGTTANQTIINSCDASGGGGSTSFTLLPDTTLIRIAITVNFVDSSGNQHCTQACFQLVQAGRITCPFSGLVIPLVSPGKCPGTFSVSPCDPSTATLTFGVA